MGEAPVYALRLELLLIARLQLGGPAGWVLLHISQVTKWAAWSGGAAGCILWPGGTISFVLLLPTSGWARLQAISWQVSVTGWILQLSMTAGSDLQLFWVGWGLTLYSLTRWCCWHSGGPIGWTLWLNRASGCVWL